MDDPNVIWRKRLRAGDFEISSIWTWDDGHDGFYPVLEDNPSVYVYDDLFIKSMFTTPTGQTFNGYLVGGGFYHAFFLFADEMVFGFNINLWSLVVQKQEDLWRYLGKDPSPLFPLSYQSSVSLKELGRVEGVLDWEG